MLLPEEEVNWNWNCNPSLPRSDTTPVSFTNDGPPHCGPFLCPTPLNIQRWSLSCTKEHKVHPNAFNKVSFRHPVHLGLYLLMDPVANVFSLHQRDWSMPGFWQRLTQIITSAEPTRSYNYEKQKAILCSCLMITFIISHCSHQIPIPSSGHKPHFVLDEVAKSFTDFKLSLRH